MYLEQQFEAGDALEGQDQKGLEGKALADGVALQPLQDIPETAAAIPAGAGSLSEEGLGRAGVVGRAWGAETQGDVCGRGKHVLAEGTGWAWDLRAGARTLALGKALGLAMGGFGARSLQGPHGDKWGVRSHSRFWKVRSW